MTDKNDILEKLEAVIESRKYGDIEKSYVAKLFGKGRKNITQKVGEFITIKGLCTGALSDVVITDGVVE